MLAFVLLYVQSTIGYKWPFSHNPYACVFDARSFLASQNRSDPYSSLGTRHCSTSVFVWCLCVSPYHTSRETIPTHTYDTLAMLAVNIDRVQHLFLLPIQCQKNEKKYKQTASRNGEDCALLEVCLIIWWLCVRSAHPTLRCSQHGRVAYGGNRKKNTASQIDQSALMVGCCFFLVGTFRTFKR